jgi:3-keto-disaccharide hydrolase
LDGGLTVKRIAALLCVALVAAVSFVVVRAPAQAPPGNGWVALFNGKDLAGWKNNGEEKWVAEQGTILCESTANKYGYLTTEKTFRDFELSLMFKGEAQGNSGVFFHSKITGIDPQHGPDIEGMQVEVDPKTGSHTGGLYESGGRGWLVTPTAAQENALKVGEWNHLEVSVKGNHIVTHLNRVLIADYIDATPKFVDGMIGLQIHTGGGVKMRWKDIYLREQ